MRTSSEPYLALCSSDDCPKSLDLFSGCGLMSFGLRRMLRPGGFCEIDPGARAVLERRMEDGSLPHGPVWPDVRALTGADVRAEIGDVDIVTGSFPCQDLSTAGVNKGLLGTRSTLFADMVRLAGELDAQYMVMENVTGVLGGGGGDFYEAFLGKMHAAGYDCRWTTATADSVGAPQRRSRWWLVARRRQSAGAAARARLEHWDTLWDNFPQTAVRALAPWRKDRQYPRSGMTVDGKVYRVEFRRPDPEKLTGNMPKLEFSGHTDLADAKRAISNSKSRRLSKTSKPLVGVRKAERWHTPLSTPRGPATVFNDRTLSDLITQVWRERGSDTRDKTSVVHMVNPEWVEMLMGIPPGWTDPSASLVTLSQHEDTEFGVPCTFRTACSQDSVSYVQRIVSKRRQPPIRKHDKVGTWQQKRICIVGNALVPFVLRHTTCALLSGPLVQGADKFNNRI